MDIDRAIAAAVVSDVDAVGEQVTLAYWIRSSRYTHGDVSIAVAIIAVATVVSIVVVVAISRGIVVVITVPAIVSTIAVVTIISANTAASVPGC